MSSKLSPKQLADEWSKRNPNRNARIDVLCMVLKGRGGRNGLGPRTYTFYACNGKVLKKSEELNGDLELVIFDLQYEPYEIMEVHTSRCFYYRKDGNMKIWQIIGGENRNILPSRVYELRSFLDSTV